MKAFTLTETLISILILSFILAALFTILNMQNVAYDIDLCLLELQQQTRLAIDSMIRELRQTKLSEINFVSAAEINFRIPPQNYGAEWIGPIRYYLDSVNNRLMREYPEGTTKILTDDVNSLVFSLAGDTVTIWLTCTKTSMNRQLPFFLREQVRLRNE